MVDLFCGIGGLSYGMKSKGFHIQGGFDLDKTCRFAYEYNNDAPFFYRDIKNVTKRDIKPLYEDGAVRILAGCAPCQPFSSYAFKNKEKDADKYDDPLRKEKYNSLNMAIDGLQYLPTVEN